MAVSPFDKKIYSFIAWKSLQEKPSFNPKANEVIAHNAGIRSYRTNHPPLRPDGIHPYVRCRRRCIYGVLPHPEPTYDKSVYDDTRDLPVIRPTRRPPKDSSTSDGDALVTEPVKVVSKSLELDEDHYCSVYSSEKFPLMGDSKVKRTFEYWKTLTYDEEVSAREELTKAWGKVMALQHRIGARQDAQLEKVLKKVDGTSLETRLYSLVFYPWNWPWKPETSSKTKKTRRKILLILDMGDLESLARKDNGSFISNEIDFPLVSLK